VQVLVGGDDRRGDLGACEQLAVVCGDEIGADLLRDQLGALGLDLRQAR